MRFSQLHLLFSCAVLVFSTAQAQSNVLSNHIPVFENNRQLPAAWAGGLSAAQFSEIDLNNDGVMDLFVFDRQDNRFMTFLNLGVQDSVHYTFAPEFIPDFPRTLRDWVLLRDFDGDGYVDLFTALASNNVQVFRNTSASNNNELAFSIAQDTLKTIYTNPSNLFVPRSDVPGIEDVDGDGDLDLLTFDTGGSFLEWHRNLSVENQGNLNGLDFELASLCFGHFRESTFGCTADVNLAPCAVGNRPGNPNPGPDDRDPRHVGSTILPLHLNGDSRIDLIIGDRDCNFTYALIDSDTSSVAHFNQLIGLFPDYDRAVDVLTFPSTYYIDVNNDGLKDFIAAPNLTGLLANERGTWWYENLGQNNSPFFNFQSEGFLQDDMIETGSGSTPTFFDHNQDGLMDLIVGNLGVFDTLGGYTPHIKLYENTGTAQNPVFTLINDDLANLASDPQFAELSYVHPTFGDLDGDGDQDMLLGSRNGGIWHFRNDATTGPANFTFVSDSFGLIAAELFTAPFLYDLDNDGDQDLLVGNLRGDIHHYENTGSPSNANFTLVTTSFGGIEITDISGSSFSNGYARPIVIDYDFDGNLEVLVGTVEGTIEVYEGFSMAPGAIFTFAGELFGYDYGSFSALTAASIDSSGQLTYLVGQLRGGLNLMRTTGFVNAEEAVEAKAGSVVVFPNPTSGRTQIRLSLERPGQRFQFYLVDAFGRVLLSDAFRGEEFSFETSGLAQGMYWVRIVGDDVQFTQKLVVR